MNRNYAATVKELSDGKPFVVLERYDEALDMMKGQSITFVFKSAEDLQAAQALAKALNDVAAHVKVTDL